MVQYSQKQCENGLTLIELMIVISLVSMMAMFVFITARGEMHQIQLGAMIQELQNITDVEGLEEYYGVEIEVDSMNSARGSIDDPGDHNAGDRYFTWVVDVPSPGGVIEPYGINTVEVTDGDGVITHSRMTFYSQQIDPLVSLYLADPLTSRNTSPRSTSP